MALIDMAVSSVCKRRGKQLLHTTGNVLQSATGFIVNESVSQRLSDTPKESQAFCCHSLFYSTTVMQVYKILYEPPGSMNESFLSLDLKYQLFHVGKAIRIQQGQTDTIYRTAVVMNMEYMEVWGGGEIQIG